MQNARGFRSSTYMMLALSMALVCGLTVSTVALDAPAQQPVWIACKNAQTTAEKISACSRAIELSKVGAVLERAYLRRGNAYLEQNMYTQAIGDFTKLIAIRPGVAGYY